MKVGLASDHAGYELKAGLSRFLEAGNIPLVDYGCGSGEKVDYVDYAIRAVEGLSAGECDRLILICGTGLGMSIVANKCKGIRATLCCDDYMSLMSRQHNNSNCLTLGGRILPLDEAEEIVKIWLETEFEAGRHAKRVEKIAQWEDKNFNHHK